MKRSTFTYGQLDRTLRALGFSCRPSTKNPPGRIYEHEASGAIVALPSYPDRQKVYEYHMVVVRGELENFGIADPATLDAKLQKAG